MYIQYTCNINNYNINLINKMVFRRDRVNFFEYSYFVINSWCC